MSETKCITSSSVLMKLPLADLGNPAHLASLSEFVDNVAVPCIAETLMAFVSTCYLLILLDIIWISFNITPYPALITLLLFPDIT